MVRNVVIVFLGIVICVLSVLWANSNSAFSRELSAERAFSRVFEHQALAARIAYTDAVWPLGETELVKRIMNGEETVSIHSAKGPDDEWRIVLVGSSGGQYSVPLSALPKGPVLGRESSQ